MAVLEDGPAVAATGRSAVRPPRAAVLGAGMVAEVHRRAALTAGEHVVCERPPGVDVPQVARTAAARGSSPVAAVPFVHRYRPLVRELRARVARGDLGVLLPTGTGRPTASWSPRSPPGARTGPGSRSTAPSRAPSSTRGPGDRVARRTGVLPDHRRRRARRRPPVPRRAVPPRGRHAHRRGRVP